MRGKHLKSFSCFPLCRITPAHAGKTPRGRYDARQCADHPRACGENNFGDRPRESKGGSPPRMRGKPHMLHVAALSGRITPAHAGKTTRLRIAAIRRADHPRACGENAFPPKASSEKLGSPPRMRGKQSSAPSQSIIVRITPAHAGKTHRISLRLSRSADHPRACGENRSFVALFYYIPGSPPRMRGKRLPKCRENPRRRITPAHAGKTIKKRTAIAMRPDHPRACGENFAIDMSLYNSPGSPPRMRGKLPNKAAFT